MRGCGSDVAVWGKSTPGWWDSQSKGCAGGSVTDTLMDRYRHRQGWRSWVKRRVVGDGRPPECSDQRVGMTWLGDISNQSNPSKASSWPSHLLSDLEWFPNAEQYQIHYPLTTSHGLPQSSSNRPPAINNPKALFEFKYLFFLKHSQVFCHVTLKTSPALKIAHIFLH